MEVRLSRHARRRARLYGYNEEDVAEVIATGSLPGDADKLMSETRLRGRTVRVVWKQKDDHIVIVTVYPLKEA